MEKLKKMKLRRSEDFSGSKELINRLSNSLFPRISVISKMSTNCTNGKWTFYSDLFPIRVRYELSFSESDLESVLTNEFFISY